MSLFYPQDPLVTFYPRRLASIFIQAGLLTLGSSYLPRLPDPLHAVSGIKATFVPDYSGGPVHDLHMVPY